jgi:hypothetical protein
MKSCRIFSFVSVLIQLFCITSYGSWSDGERVNYSTTGNQNARQIESTWDMCVDDSLIVQIVWENAPGEGKRPLLEEIVLNGTATPIPQIPALNLPMN